MIGAPVSRRRALGLIALGSAGVTVGATGWAASLSSPADTASRLLPGASGQLLIEPPVLASHHGVLDVGLIAAPGVALAGRDTAALGYNNTSPGPILRVAPGEVLRIRLTNHLQTPTNLHTHGLHVSPEGNGDNPFVSIAPGAAFDYAYRVPADHPAGTYWYHPHHHGHIADQLFGGLVGALLIDHGPVLPVTGDRVLLVTEVAVVPARPGTDGAVILHLCQAVLTGLVLLAGLGLAWWLAPAPKPAPPGCKPGQPANRQ